MDKISWLKDVIYILPVAILIWKAAGLAAELKHQQLEMKELKDTVARHKVISDDVMKSVANSLNDLKIAMARVETKLETRKVEDENR